MTRGQDGKSNQLSCLTRELMYFTIGRHGDIPGHSHAEIDSEGRSRDLA